MKRIFAFLNGTIFVNFFQPLKNQIMKNFIYLATFFCFSSFMSAQIFELEKNPNWTKYKSIIKSKLSQNGNGWKYIYDLNDGTIDKLKTYYGTELRAEYELTFDKNQNLERLNNISNLENQFVEYNLKYNDLGLKIEDKETKYFYDNANRLTKSFSKEFEESNGKKGWSEKYFYNDLGDLIRLEKTTFIKDKSQVDIENYIYDDCKNTIQINRSSMPERVYPIVIIGGELKNEVDFYEYEYNEDCIWTKKYNQIDGVKKLIWERELVEL